MRGFSLVELSIVLVILGLLTGGILAGQSLIRASELRAVSTEYQRYITAAQTFRDKYFAIPGDFNNATKFWGDDNAACPDAAVPNGTPGTCNGDGDGVFDAAAAPSVTGERFQFWKHLQLAGLIEGSYTGLAGGNGTADHDLGSNCPASKLSAAGWGVEYVPSPFAGNADFYAVDMLNHFRVGVPSATGGPNVEVLKPEEAWNIDTKMDDGKPARGKVIAADWNDLCAAADDGTSAQNDLNASYRLSDNSAQCILNFIRQF